jgi:hypothetical protein
LFSSPSFSGGGVRHSCTFLLFQVWCAQRFWGADPILSPLVKRTTFYLFSNTRNISGT